MGHGGGCGVSEWGRRCGVIGAGRAVRGQWGGGIGVGSLSGVNEWGQGVGAVVWEHWVWGHWCGVIEWEHWVWGHWCGVIGVGSLRGDVELGHWCGVTEWGH